MIFVKNSESLKSDVVSDWPLPKKILGCATALLTTFWRRFCLCAIRIRLPPDAWPGGKLGQCPPNCKVFRL